VDSPLVARCESAEIRDQVPTIVSTRRTDSVRVAISPIHRISRYNCEYGIRDSELNHCNLNKQELSNTVTHVMNAMKNLSAFLSFVQKCLELVRWLYPGTGDSWGTSYQKYIHLPHLSNQGKKGERAQPSSRLPKCKTKETKKNQ
jgi:hypothetical protein